VVLDTNIIISALVFNGREREVLGFAALGLYELHLSPYILDEVEGVLRNKFTWSDARIAKSIKTVRGLARLETPKEQVMQITRDTDDNRILECALSASADYLVTGDKRDLLPLSEFQGTQIISSAQFHALLLAQE
jgi:putative PIN family toxin of toxin-antitoxin system